MRTRSLLPLALGVAALAGCGQAEDRGQVRDVAERFAAALADGDGAAACGLLSEPAVEALQRQEQAPCEQAIVALGLDAGPVERVRVYLTNAQVELAGGESAYLDRAREGWRLSALGCRFEDGKPSDRPATCEVEA